MDGLVGKRVRSVYNADYGGIVAAVLLAGDGTRLLLVDEENGQLFEVFASGMAVVKHEESNESGT